MLSAGDAARSLRALVLQRGVVDVDDHLADRPQRDAGEFQMRPRERDTDEGDGEQKRGDEMAERQPPAGEHEPQYVADEAEGPGADVVSAEILGARYGFAAERQQRVGGDIERRARPGDADDGDRHDGGGDDPAERHPDAAKDEPQRVKHDRDWRHGIYSPPMRSRCPNYAAWPSFRYGRAVLLLLLRQHQVFGLEVVPRVGDQPSVAR